MEIGQSYKWRLLNPFPTWPQAAVEHSFVDVFADLLELPWHGVRSFKSGLWGKKNYVALGK